MRWIKTLIALCSAFIVAGLCAYLFFLFYQIHYLSRGLVYTLCFLCVVGLVADIALTGLYIRGLFSAPEDEAKGGKK